MRVGLVIFLLTVVAASAFAATRYLDASCTNPVSPFNAGWTTAATNISDVMAVAAGGDTIYVTNGTYTATNEIVIATNIVIQSMTGWSNTTIRTATGRVFYVTHPGVVIDGFTIRDGNAPTDNGGGIYMTAGTVRNSHITANWAKWGGGIYMTSGTVENCIITTNRQPQGIANEYVGTGIKIAGADCVVSNCTIEGNYPGKRSGYNNGLNCHAAGVDITDGLMVDCVITNNSGTGKGGGIAVRGGTVRGCLIVDNRVGYLPGVGWVKTYITAYGGGGGVYIEAGVMENCTIRNNVDNTDAVGSIAEAGGGGIRAHGGTVRNCLVVENELRTVANGGGIWVSGGSPVIENCTVVENRTAQASSSGGGLYQEAGLVQNTIVYNNACAAGTDHNHVLSSGTVSNSCMTPVVAGANNTALNPEFADSSMDDYSLMPGSPCRDTGTDQPWMGSAVDLAGTNRILNGTVDMGAYEAASPDEGSFVCNFVGSPLSGPAPLSVVFTAHVSGSDTNGLYYWWDFDNSSGAADTEGSTKTVVTNVYSAGSYAVRLTVSNSVAAVTNRLKVDYIVVQGSTTYVATNGAHTAPFATWATAATNVHDAVALAVSNVWISNGTFAVTEQIWLSTDFAIRSVNGWSNTMLERVGSAEFRIFRLDHSNAVLEGLTIKNGDLPLASGGGVYMTAGTVRDCYITGNSAKWAGGIYMSGGRVESCTISTNTQPDGVWRDWIGAGMRIVGADCVVTNCTIIGNHPGRRPTYNHGVDGRAAGVDITAGLIVDCLITNNSSSGTGGGIAVRGGTARRCEISGNQVGYVVGIGWKETYGSCFGGGGGAYIDSGLIENCIISGNIDYTRNTHSTLSKGGGGLRVAGGTVRNCLVENNELRCTGSGGGIWMSGGSPVVENCTVVNNETTQSSSSAGGLAQDAGEVRNTIVYYNSCASGTDHNHVLVGGSVSNSCMTPVVAGTNNTADSPEFFNNAGDYGLMPGSPCRDTGVTQSWMAAAVDLGGTNRVLNGAVDMGAYEAPPPDEGWLLCNFDAVPQSGAEPLAAVFTAYVSGSNTNGLYYWWDFDNSGGVADEEGSNKAVVTNVYSGGLYSVMLTVSNVAGTVTNRLKVDYITVKAITSYVATNGGSVFPYDSWANAATSIHDAVSASVSNVWVSNGIFDVSEQIWISTDYAVRSVGGWQNTILTRVGAAEFRVFTLDHSNAVLDGLTIKNGSLPLDSGGGISMSAGTVRNCHITENSANWAGGIYMSGGRVENCMISANTQPEGKWRDYFGVGMQITGAGCVVTNCNIVGNYVGKRPSYNNGTDARAAGVDITAGLIVDCTISNNYASGAGGGIAVRGGTALRCVIVSNRVGYVQTASGWVSTYGSCYGGGGGAYIDAGLMEHCTIRGNIDYTWNTHSTLSRGGGGIRAAGGTVRNCLIADNQQWSAADGGGIWMSGGAPLVESCTVVTNIITVAGNSGGGIQCDAGMVSNTIAYYNYADGVATNAGGALTNFGYCCASELTAGVDGNINSAPVFESLADGIYVLKGGSPGIDAGHNEPWMSDALDLADRNRIQAAIVDMGAYESLGAGTIFIIR